MSSVNKVILIGNLGKDPESKYMANGDAICNVTLATSEKYTDKDGEKVEKTEWHRVVFFKRLAEVVAEYCSKGSQIYVEGRIKTRKYEKDGVTHYATEIFGDRMQLLGRKGGGESSVPAEREPAKKTRAEQSADLNEDISF